jgi:hypothetical protein
MKKLVKNQRLCVQWLPLATILPGWRRLVASNKALNFLHWVMRVVSYRLTSAAIKMASKVYLFFVAILFAVALAAAGVIRSK